MDNEPFSNPLAPPSLPPREDAHGQPLTNADFRKLMMTPRAVSANSSHAGVPGSIPGSIRSKHHKPYTPKSEASENQKKKKKFYESIKKHEDELLSELAKKYRDRAKERRDFSGSDKGADFVANTAYHAVGPDNFDMDATERRRQMIQESKYLGGDMEHTHLVKGLDYALLQKVKTEIQTKEDEERYIKLKAEEESRKEEEKKKKSQAGLSKLADITFDDNDRYAVKGKVAENILKAVFNSKPPERNELFIQGRMAYQYDLVSEFAESDIPTTIIRSKAECPSLEAYNSISTNEIVINKLVQIWLYLRQGGGSAKAKKPKVEAKHDDTCSSKSALKGDSIYDDVGDYVPIVKPRYESNKKKESREKRDSYFGSAKSEPTASTGDIDRRTSEQRALELAASVVGSFAATSDSVLKTGSKRKSKQEEPDSYAECYPGALEHDDAILDSDDEVDYSKMDVGTKKGMVNRWDFDSVEEYGDYMSNREAMPKAAFQYGVKMGDGRKSKKPKSGKEEKAKLDRDLQKINAILAKRKQSALEGNSFGAD